MVRLCAINVRILSRCYLSTIDYKLSISLLTKLVLILLSPWYHFVSVYLISINSTVILVD